MRCKQISVFLLGLGLIFVLINSTSVHIFATTTIEEPELSLKGTLVKDVTNLSNIFEYTDENEATKELPYSPDIDSNITFLSLIHI